MADVIAFRTNDMVLATLLYMEGCEYTHELNVTLRANGDSNRQCVWVFDGVDRALLDKFEAGEYCVEPREFARTWADVRSDMFAFLNG